MERKHVKPYIQAFVKLILGSGYVYYGEVIEADESTITLRNPKHGLTTIALSEIIGIYETEVKA